MPGQSFRGFTERVALVTGGAQGVGRAVALQLALAGAYVIVSYAPGDAEGGRVAGELHEMGTLARACEADIARASDVRRLFAAVEAAFGRLDMMVNAADVLAEPAPLDDLTEANWEEAFNVSLKGAYLCAQAAARLMRARPSPAIVHLASDAGVTGIGAAHTVAAHAGLVGLTRALARELAPRIRVNCVASAGVESGDVMSSPGVRMEAATQTQQALEREAGSVPPQTASPRLAPDEAARACVFLLSPEAGSITGQILVVGGGRI